MNSFFKHASSKVTLFSHKYANRSRKAALSLAWWNFRQFIARCPDKSHSTGWYTLVDYYGRRKLPSSTDMHLPKIGRGHIYFDIEKALKCFPHIKRIGLVFFMGVGDYFYATQFIKILHDTYPQLALDAYVSNQFDTNNSPLVATCLENNPCIEHIYMYNGKAYPRHWKNYDWNECYQKASKDTLLLPVVYEHDSYVTSRTRALCETFGIPVPMLNPRPLVHDYPLSSHVKQFFEQYGAALDKVVFLQCSNRSSNFVYPHHDELAQKLLDENYFVITVEKTSISSPRLWQIDIKNMKITETLALLQELHRRKIPTYMITTFSCFNSVSSALDIPNLSMQCTFDPAIGSVIYNNIFLISTYIYPQVLSERLFVATEGTFYTQDEKDIFSPNFVKTCFDKMLQITNHK